jgi:1,4-dihydroxy-2-naphthoate octaprenyltransferase
VPRNDGLKLSNLFPLALNHWLSAFRLRTLPLALSSILMGNVLAASKGAFRWDICMLAMLTTLFLQILSNLANDYGDSQNGADNELRSGPQRAVQSGAISKEQMLVGIVIFGLLSLTCGLALLQRSIGFMNLKFYMFLALGVSAIAAAVKYTAGKNPYGYAGLGDISVFIFFGIVGVCGTYYLQTSQFGPEILLPAYSCGVFSVAVLNLNNMRDILPDTMAGKRTIPVRIGYQQAKFYHFFLILSGFVAAVIYQIAFVGYNHIMFFLAVLFFWGKDLKTIMQSNPSDKIDPFLKKTALGTLLFVALFGVGLLF